MQRTFQFLISGRSFSVPPIFVQWARSVTVREAETRGTGVNWRGLSAFHSLSCYPCGTRNAVLVVAFKIHHETKVIFRGKEDKEERGKCALVKARALCQLQSDASCTGCSMVTVLFPISTFHNNPYS